MQFSSPSAPAALPRGVAYARVWTVYAEPITPAQLADALAARGFVPGVTAGEGDKPLLADAGLADAVLTLDSPGWRFISLSSSRGNGCLLQATTPDNEPLPDHPIARTAVRHPRLVYTLVAGGPSNSDRNLCENLAEILMELQNGVVEIGGRGTKGNRPTVYTHAWLGSLLHG